MQQACPDCGYKFPVIEREAEKLHHVGAILSTEVPPVHFPVRRVEYTRHVGKSGVPTLRVSYYGSLMAVSEYVCLEHQGYARAKAVAWWVDRSDLPAPATVEHALAITPSLAQPTSLQVNFASKFPEIKTHVFPVELSHI